MSVAIDVGSGIWGGYIGTERRRRRSRIDPGPVSLQCPDPVRVSAVPGLVGVVKAEGKKLEWWKPPPPPADKAAIVSAYKAGALMSALGVEHGISRERVRQIIVRWEKDQGVALARNKPQSKLDERVCPACGETFIREASDKQRACSRKCAGVLKRTDLPLEAISRDRQLGVSYAALGGKYGVAGHTIRTALIYAGLMKPQRKEHGRRHYDWRRLRPKISRLLASGVSRDQIATQLNIHPATLRSWIKRSQARPAASGLNQRIAELWPDHDARAIAELVGLTRNAVIGRADRMGLAHKAPPRSMIAEFAQLTARFP